MASKGVYTSIVVVSPDLLFPTSSISSAVKSPENPDDPEPATAVDIQMEFSSDLLYSQRTRAVTKNYLLRSWVSICTV